MENFSSITRPKDIITKEYLEANSLTLESGDGRYVQITGDTVTGDLDVVPKLTGGQVIGKDYVAAASNFRSFWNWSATPADTADMYMSTDSGDFANATALYFSYLDGNGNGNYYLGDLGAGDRIVILEEYKTAGDAAFVATGPAAPDGLGVRIPVVPEYINGEPQVILDVWIASIAAPAIVLRSRVTESTVGESEIDASGGSSTLRIIAGNNPIEIQTYDPIRVYSSALILSNTPIQDVATPQNSYDAATKEYVDSTVASNAGTQEVFIEETEPLPTGATLIWVDPTVIEEPGGPGQVSIDWLGDVDTSTVLPAVGDSLTWNGTHWVPGVGAGADSALNDLTDVDTATTAPQTGNTLIWNGSQWVPGAPAAAGLTRVVLTVSGNTGATNALLTDYVYLCSAALTLTMPTAAGNLNRYTIKRTGTGTVTVNTTASQTIDGAATYTLATQWQSIDLVSNGTAWMVI